MGAAADRACAAVIDEAETAGTTYAGARPTDIGAFEGTTDRGAPFNQGMLTGGAEPDCTHPGGTVDTADGSLYGLAAQALTTEGAAASAAASDGHRPWALTDSIDPYGQPPASAGCGDRIPARGLRLRAPSLYLFAAALLGLAVVARSRTVA